MGRVYTLAILRATGLQPWPGPSDHLSTVRLFARPSSPDDFLRP